MSTSPETRPVSAPTPAAPASASAVSRSRGLAQWLLHHRVESFAGPKAKESHHEEHAWWKVICDHRRDPAPSIRRTASTAVRNRKIKVIASAAASLALVS
jgi:hypothetical protein